MGFEATIGGGENTHTEGGGEPIGGATPSPEAPQTGGSTLPAEAFSQSVTPEGEVLSDFQLRIREHPNATVRENQRLSAIRDEAELIERFVERESYLGTNGAIPPKNDSPEEMARWRSELPENMRRPETPEKYDLGDLGLDKNVPWDADFQKTMLGIMHEAELPNGTAQKLFGAYAEWAKGQRETVSKASVELEGKLRGEWGGEADANIDYAKRVARQLGADADAWGEVKLADGRELADHPASWAIFAKIGRMLSQDRLVGGESSGIGFQLGPEEAKARREELYSDPHFGKNTSRGNQLVKELMALNRIIAPGGDSEFPIV
jgi:hypothetical protein